MIIFKKAVQISEYLKTVRSEGKKIGFVPTMGALHKGHLSLIETARQNNDLVVCSIFVNPTQFNNPEDFKHYPITIEKDIEQLVSHQCTVLFLPPVEEIYPKDYKKKQYDLGEIERRLEGSFRPGHFQGVCQVVDRLLDIICPDHLYMGQKDLQQCLVIRKLLDLTGKAKNIELQIVPTVREQDGLAMSSRNLRLDEQQRKLATGIYRELEWIRNHMNETSFETLTKMAEEHLTKEGFHVDYVAIADTTNLSPATSTSQPIAALAAASLGNIRLIDNLILN